MVSIASTYRKTNRYGHSQSIRTIVHGKECGSCTVSVGKGDSTPILIDLGGRGRFVRVVVGVGDGSTAASKGVGVNEFVQGSRCCLVVVLHVVVFVLVNGFDTMTRKGPHNVAGKG